MSESAVSVSVVLPAYNEATTLASTVEATLATLATIDRIEDFEVIIAEDGCTDDTPTVAADLAASDARIGHLHSPSRLGRGRALERALEVADGDIFVYFDTDLATDLHHLEDLIATVADGTGAIAVGSRLRPDSEVERPTVRAIPSAVYNALVRGLLGSSVYDHQCGFKAFDREVLESIIAEVDAEHWFWDTEVLVRAQAHGHRVIELPVRWSEPGDSTVNVAGDSVSMGRQLLGLWWRLRLQPAFRRYRAPLALILTLLLGYLVLEVAADPGEILDEIARVDPWLLAVAAAVYLVSWPIRGLRYRDILVHLGYTERVGFLTGAVFVSQMGNLLVPARAGDAVRAYVMKVRRDVPYPSGFASLAIERLFDLLSITLLAGGVIVGIAISGGPDTVLNLVGDPEVNGGRLALALALGVGVTAVLGFVVLIATARMDDRVFRRFVPSGDSRVSKTIRLMGAFFKDIRAVSTRPTAIARIGVTSVAIWTIDVATAVVVLLAFDVGLEATALVLVSFLAVCIGNLAKIIPISPGGIGPYEAVFAIVLVSLTPIGVSVAVGAAIVDHAIKNLVTAIGGALSTGVLNVSLVTAVREGSAGSTSRDSSVPEPLPPE